MAEFKIKMGKNLFFKKFEECGYCFTTTITEAKVYDSLENAEKDRVELNLIDDALQLEIV